MCVLLTFRNLHKITVSNKKPSFTSFQVKIFKPIWICGFLFSMFYACNQHKIPVKCGDTVTLAYKITNTEGMRLDESFLHDNFNQIQENELFRFTTCNEEVIPGWDSVIIGCKTGKIYTFDIPASLAYGKSDIYHDIPRGSDIIFKFKIFKIE